MPGLVIPLMLGLATSHSVGANNDFADAKIDGFKIKQTLDLVLEGKQTFRFDTFGDQDFWGGQLRLHEAIAGEANGGVGPGITARFKTGVFWVPVDEPMPTGKRQLIEGVE